MSVRCYFQFVGEEYDNPSFFQHAISSLSEHQVGDFNIEHSQMHAWKEELDILGQIAHEFPQSTIALEYMIPRMGKRVDAILLIENYIFILEFKIGEKRFLLADIDQTADYAFDIKNFHSGSADRTIFPILVCTHAPNEDTKPPKCANSVYSVQTTNHFNLLNTINNTINNLCIHDEKLDHEAWLNSIYRPTPTIVEAAQALYKQNTVEDISRNEAGSTNISITTECINNIVRYSKTNNRKSICFITGVPGAGKTLVGLNLAATHRPEASSYSEEAAVFLSGNGPLIEVLQESLARDQQHQNKQICSACKTGGLFATEGKIACHECAHSMTKAQIKSEIKSFVQGVHLFREELFNSDDAPYEHIAIFDEAQRAWTAEQMDRKRKTSWKKKAAVNRSEPRCLMEYMNRHEDWACMVCLVGGGQEINQGEAGVIEWFKAIRDYYPSWDVYVSSAIQGENYLESASPEEFSSNIKTIDALHLSVDMRSFRNKNVAAFAEALVSNRPEDAHRLYSQINAEYPIFITRDLDAAKKWVRINTVRPSDRFGIVADSFGQRARADGIIVPTSDFDAIKWFLNGRDDVDSSYFMEIAASEFKIQGLEIDFAVIAWEADYRYHDGSFHFHRFHGGKWQNVNSEMDRRYLRNGYRVLLTRARQGYVIYVPRGSDFDQTRSPEYYDETYRYLLSAGIKELA